MDRQTYYHQMFEYYDGAKHGHDFDGVRDWIRSRHADPSGDVRYLIEVVSRLLAGRRVLEVGCGAGFWTEYLARAARSVHALDQSPNLIRVARELVSAETAEFEERDVRDLSALPRDFDAAFHFNFINHLPLDYWAQWIDHLHSRLAPRAVVVFGGQMYRGEFHGQDGPDRFSRRPCSNGRTYVLVDNVPDPCELRALLGSRAERVEVETRERMWLAHYRLPASLDSDMAG